MSAVPVAGLYDDVHRALHGAGVRYVVVGGTAVVVQGYARLTVDLDLVVDLAPTSARAAVSALTALGLLPRLPVPAMQFADPDLRRDWVERRNLRVFSLYDPANPLREVDLFARDPLPFGELYAAADVVEIAGTAVRVASKEHLIAMKLAAGRPQDLADIHALRQLDEQ